jgi:CBS domain-containing protein
MLERIMLGGEAEVPMKARDLMTTTLSTCSEDDSLARAAQIMWENDCGCLPVFEQSGRLVGMITDRDICMAAYTRGKALDADTVGSAMTRDVASCHADDSVGTVEEIMRDRQVRRVPVMEQSRMIGIITLGDLVRSTQMGALRATMAAPGVLKAAIGIYERRATMAAAE